MNFILIIIILETGNDSGRFLFPKELGRDHFFTSISRSRLEGLGAVNVFTVSCSSDLNIKSFNCSITYTKIKGPTIGTYQFNKYNIDAYSQVNFRLHYELKDFFKGVTFDVLYVHKKNISNSDPVIIFNRSNFNQINFITNYNF